MNYTKPEVVSTGRAVAMIESSQKDDQLPVDQSLDAARAFIPGGFRTRGGI